jgi:hypothetical protein
MKEKVKEKKQRGVGNVTIRKHPIQIGINYNNTALTELQLQLERQMHLVIT